MTTQKKDTPAFPPNAGWRDNDHDCRGMTLRQWYAGQALAGMTANPEHNDTDWETIVELSFHAADAMIAAEQVSS